MAQQTEIVAVSIFQDPAHIGGNGLNGVVARRVGDHGLPIEFREVRFDQHT